LFINYDEFVAKLYEDELVFCHLCKEFNGIDPLVSGQEVMDPAERARLVER